MSVLIENEHDYQFDFDYQNVAKTVVETVLATEKCPYEAGVNIDLIDDEEILAINKDFRGINDSTDVLSFPMLEFPKPADYDILKGGGAPFFDHDSGELILGDVAISIPTMLRQAKEYEHGVKREYAFLIAHSVLHLLGYDHMDEKETRVMEEKQEAILNKLKITR